MHENDIVRLRHILDAAREAQAFATGKSRSDLDSDRMLLLSLVKEIEIIGEAASRLSPEVKSKYPQVPWQDITSMRHRLIHSYFDVNPNIVWDTIIKDLPPLIAEVEKIISAQESE